MPNRHRFEIAVRRFPAEAIVVIEIAGKYSNMSFFGKICGPIPLRQKTVESVALLESNNKPFKSYKGADGGEYQPLDSIYKDN